MKYSTGEVIKVGDSVFVEDGTQGIVVCDFDNGESLENYTDWNSTTELTGGGTLSSGVLIKTEAYGLIHYPQEDVSIVKKGDENDSPELSK